MADRARWGKASPGLDAPEGMARDFLSQLLGFADALRGLVPAVTVHEE